MPLMRLITFAVLVFFLTVSLWAQEKTEDPEAEKKRRFDLVVEQVLAEIPNLRRSENRAYIYCKTASLLWQSDQKRARELFQQSITELVTVAQTAAETKNKARYQNDLQVGQNLRNQILGMLGPYDAALGLEALQKTRPPQVAEALAFQQGKNTKVSQFSQTASHIVRSEIALEQSLIRMAAAQNPERAAKLLRDSLKKGLSHESVNLLNKLIEKDPEAARELASEIVARVLAGKFIINNQPDHDSLNITSNLLNSYLTRQNNGDKNAAAFDAAEMRRLADSYVAFHLDTRFRNYGFHLPPVIQIAQKLAPGAVDSLKAAQRELQRRSGGDEFYEEINTLIGGDVTAQQLIAEARKYPVSHRGRIYEAAASKFASQGDFDGARQLIEDNFSDQALAQAMNNLNSNRFYQLQNQGKFTEAELLIDTLPEGNQFSSLVSLAHAVYQRNPEENRAYAAGLLVKARSMLPERPETSSEMQNMLQLISAAVNLDIDEAFRLFAAITPQMNEVTEASLIVNAFHNNYNIRDGEMIISNGNPSGLYIDSNLMERLAEKDFDRTMVLIDGFSRRESRISLKLQLAERGGFRNLHVITTSHGSQRGRH